MRAYYALALILVSAACGSDHTGGPQGLKAGDFDDDGISDEDEGRAENVDTDGDGLPDFRDFDSDADGVRDAAEAGDDDPATVAVDTDGDGLPDFRDLDSDGDGLSDSDELSDDFELVDTDGDGIFDVLDLDSDADTIADAQEANLDTDRDGSTNARDLDSDGDGIPDACEAGDDNVGTQPVDTDIDGYADFRDLDADDDGIPDAEEDANGNCKVDPGEGSSRSSDTNGNGVPDLVERIAGTDPSDPASTIPATDFYFVLPFEKERGSGELAFATSVRQADIFFSIDNTGSMDGETANIQANLVSTIIPQIGAVIPNAAFGVGSFQDFPIDPFGNPSARPYDLLQAVTTSTMDVGLAINALPAPFGGLDVPESGYEALYQWATGVGVPSFGLPAFVANQSGIGGAGFRKDSLPIVVHITDSTSHVPSDYVGFESAAHGRDELIRAYKAVGARIVGINSLENDGTVYDPREQLEDLAVATRAHIPTDAQGQCPTGVGGAPYPPVQINGQARCPVVFDVKTDGSGLSSRVVDAIKQLAETGEIDVSTRPVGKTMGERGEVLAANTTTADFIKSIVPVPPAPEGASIDGALFRNVKPGAQVTFRLDAHNDFVPETSTEQLFTIDIQVLGDFVTLLDTRRVFVVVPKKLDVLVVQ